VLRFATTGQQSSAGSRIACAIVSGAGQRRWIRIRERAWHRRHAEAGEPVPGRRDVADAFAQCGRAGAGERARPCSAVRLSNGRTRPGACPRWCPARVGRTAPCAWSTVSCMVSSSRFGGGMGS